MSKTWVMSDIHGQGDLFNYIYKQILKDDDTIYFLGDAIDRGPKGWEILKTILNDPRFIMLKGNHEDMMIQYFQEQNLDNKVLWYYNGGEATHKSLISDSDSDSIIEKVVNLQTLTTYDNRNGEHIIMSHSGAIKGDEYNRMWNRTHFWGPIPQDIIIHGHTPIPYVLDELKKFHEWNGEYFTEGNYESGALWYAKGHKCCVDCGAHFTNTTVLLNLDTWEEEIIEL